MQRTEVRNVWIESEKKMRIASYTCTSLKGVIHKRAREMGNTWKDVHGKFCFVLFFYRTSRTVIPFLLLLLFNRNITEKNKIDILKVREHGQGAPREEVI